MFADNSIKSVFRYFNDKLKGLYSEREIQIFCELSLESKCGITKTDIILNEKRFSESELLTFRDISKRLKEHEPIQYILKEAYFYGLSFHVEKGVLIPRPETEELVDLIIKDTPTGSLLDIGTGSGIIPISIKKNFPAVQVTAIDISADALKIAEINAKKNQVEIDFIEMDILTKDLAKSEFNIIVSNPPYVLASDKKEMTAGVLDFEPGLALFVDDENPLLFYKRITELATSSLKIGGKLYFEIHENFGAEVKSLLEDHQFKNVVLISDMQGKHRFVIGVK